MSIFKGKPENGPVQHTTLSESMQDIESPLALPQPGSYCQNSRVNREPIVNQYTRFSDCIKHFCINQYVRPYGSVFSLDFLYRLPIGPLRGSLLAL